MLGLYAEAFFFYAGLCRPDEVSVPGGMNWKIPRCNFSGLFIRLSTVLINVDSRSDFPTTICCLVNMTMLNLVTLWYKNSL
jgi:hypothetical protein